MDYWSGDGWKVSTRIRPESFTRFVYHPLFIHLSGVFTLFSISGGVGDGLSSWYIHSYCQVLLVVLHQHMGLRALLPSRRLPLELHFQWYSRVQLFDSIWMSFSKKLMVTSVIWCSSSNWFPASSLILKILFLSKVQTQVCLSIKVYHYLNRKDLSLLLMGVLFKISCIFRSHVRRSANVVAHMLAELSKSFQGFKVWTLDRRISTWG